MKISYLWIKELVDIKVSSDELGKAFPAMGLSVESVIAPGREIQSVVTGQILKIRPHPSADRLILCEVNVGRPEPLHIVCGAKNIKEGDRVPLALEGASLPGGIKIKRSRIRGEESCGMLCSSKELGLSQDSDGIMILKEGPLGRDIRQILKLDDVIYDLEITSNRPDYLGHIGVSRQVAAYFRLPIKYPATDIVESSQPTSSAAKVEIVHEQFCSRYAARVMKRVQVGPSPEWLVRRLDALGLRSINNVVDATNLILMETGHPLHAFDYDQLNNHEIIVRSAKDGEKIQTLDGVIRSLNPEILVIADGKRAVALAGIMGGQETAVQDRTVNILIESAWFDPVTIRRGARSLGLTTDASYRFERRADIEGLKTALDRTARLIQETAGGEILSGIIDIYPGRMNEKMVTVRPERVCAVLGVTIEPEEIKDILQRLSFTVTGTGPYTVCVPSWRRDISEEIDLVEDIGVLYGYDRIPVRLPNGFIQAPISDTPAIDRRIRHILAGFGLHEVLVNSLVNLKKLSEVRMDENAVQIMNPLTEDRNAVRTNLIFGLLDVIGYNLRQGQTAPAFFEIGRVFCRKGGEYLESSRLAVAFGSQDTKGGNHDLNLLKGYLEGLWSALGFPEPEVVISSHSQCHPGRQASIQIEGKDVGWMGQIHPELLDSFDKHTAIHGLEISLDETYSFIKKNSMTKFKDWPKFPGIKRDIALLVSKDITAREIRDLIINAGRPLLEQVTLFDVYEGVNIPKDKKSLGYGIMYRSKERTLTDGEVDIKHQEIIKMLKETMKADIR